MSVELKAKLIEYEIILNYFLFFLIILTCSRYAFKEIILVKLHPIQKLLRRHQMLSAILSFLQLLLHLPAKKCDRNYLI